MLYQLECNRRGYYQIGPLVLETGDLFGLHRRYRVVTEPHFLLVYPEVVPLEGYDIASRRPIGEVRLSHRLFEDPTRDRRRAALRGRRSAEPRPLAGHRAHRRAAQQGLRAVDRGRGDDRCSDFHRAGLSDERHEPLRSELAVTAAASLANAVYQMGQQVGLVTNGRDAADRIRQEGWDHDFRSRTAAQKPASMVDASDRLQPVRRRDPPRPRATGAWHLADARPRRTDRRPDLCPTRSRNGQPPAARRHGRRHSARRSLRADGRGPGQP